MFTPARYVIVDDNPTELRQLADSLQQVGAPCLPLVYDEVSGIDSRHLRGVRLLFLDLHLTTGGQSGNVAQVAAVIIAMLEGGISPGTPYVIILWTKHAEQKDEVTTYLMENLEPLKRPIAILSLNKNDYLTGENEAMSAENGAKLTADVARIIETDPRLRALLDWEREVLRAAGSTLAEIGNLVAAEDRTATRFSDRLDEILSLLAFEAVGKSKAKDDPYSAVNAALMPILSDRLGNQKMTPESRTIWAAAVTRTENVPSPSLEEAARLNTMLHVASPTAEDISPGAWGAVTLIPEAELADGPMLHRFVQTSKPMLSQTFCLTDKAEKAASKLCLLRVGASCDYAQGRNGPVPFVLGAIVPAAAARREKQIPQAEIATPPVIMEGFDGPVRILFNTHLQITMAPDEYSGWPALGRLRESLLMQVTTYAARHSTRPAIISFRPDKPLVVPEPCPVSQE